MNSLLTKKKNELQRKKKKGFTLVELIIVIAVIAILVALAIPKFGEIIKNSNEKADMATGKNIATVIAQQIANGVTIANSGDISTTSAVFNKLDGNKKPKASTATDFSYNIDGDGNITVNYKGGTEVYPNYVGSSGGSGSSSSSSASSASGPV